MLPVIQDRHDNMVWKVSHIMVRLYTGYILIYMVKHKEHTQATVHVGSFLFRPYTWPEHFETNHPSLSTMALVYIAVNL